ncbi:hypothetical protein FA13DRAFT_361470 [Coprinellus micaceus]|uniref:Uncharacterized protein n=1 Tax=Coprinellus micaceus TaxID=71717 RepID=A0A4Y7TB33_COPMI|nr:hypothetical protein FA13DRAFT_361470 [Coprinellus micaceus]
MSNPFVIVDDTMAKLEGTGWDQQATVEGAYNGTLAALRSNGGANVGNMTLHYPAWSELRLVGRASGDLRMNYTTGNETRAARFNISDPVPSKDRAVLWNLTSPVSNERLALRPLEGSFSLDYIAYRPEQGRVRQGDVVLLDNTHPYINYQGRWRQDITIPAALPFSGQWFVATNDAGFAPSLSTRFRGSRIAVYGAYNHAAGDLKMVYSTEMGADRVTYPANRVDTNPNNWTVGLLYEKFLDPYRTVQRFDMYMENWQGNQTFCLDYLLYDAVDEFQSTVPPSDDTRPPTPGSEEGVTGRDRTSISTGVGITASVILAGLIGWKLYTRHRSRAMARRMAPVRRQSHELQVIPQVEREPEAPPPWSPPANPEGGPPPPVFESIASDSTMTDASHPSTREGRISVELPPTYSESPSAPPANNTPSSPRTDTGPTSAGQAPAVESTSSPPTDTEPPPPPSGVSATSNVAGPPRNADS